MLQCILIGHLGADAEYKNENGKEFIAFRVANTDKWTDDAGQTHETTTWVDCIMNGKPKVFDFLKRGQQIYVSGAVKLRVYSSKKDKCMKAGLTISVKAVELIGGKTDEIPSTLIDPTNNSLHQTSKYYWCEDIAGKLGDGQTIELISRANDRYVVDNGGWVHKVTEESETQQ